jgi:hypothetical protein
LEIPFPDLTEIVANRAKDRLKGSLDLHVGVNGPLFDDDMSEDFECLQYVFTNIKKVQIDTKTAA